MTPASIVPALLDLMPSSILCTPVTLDDTGGPVATGGAVLDLPCHIQGKQMLVRDSGGTEVVSTLQAYVGSTDGPLTADGYRFALPSRPTPNTNLRAINVQPADDETGRHHQVVFFP